MDDLLSRILAGLVEIDNGMETPCLVWTGSKNGAGYGQVRISRRPVDRRQVVHVAYWEQIKGPVPEGLVLDHLCPEKACVRHTEPVTQKENVDRGLRRHGLHYRRSTIPG